MITAHPIIGQMVGGYLFSPIAYAQEQTFLVKRR